MGPQIPHGLCEGLEVITESLPARFFLFICFHKLVDRLFSRLLGGLQLPDRLRGLRCVLVCLTLVVFVPAKLLVQLVYFIQVLLKFLGQNFLVLLVDDYVLLHLIEPGFDVFTLLL